MQSKPVDYNAEEGGSAGVGFLSSEDADGLFTYAADAFGTFYE